MLHANRLISRFFDLVAARLGAGGGTGHRREVMTRVFRALTQGGMASASELEQMTRAAGADIAAAEAARQKGIATAEGDMIETFFAFYGSAAVRLT